MRSYLCAFLVVECVYVGSCVIPLSKNKQAGLCVINLPEMLLKCLLPILGHHLGFHRRKLFVKKFLKLWASQEIMLHQQTEHLATTSGEVKCY